MKRMQMRKRDENLEESMVTMQKEVEANIANLLVVRLWRATMEWQSLAPLSNGG